MKETAISPGPDSPHAPPRLPFPDPVTSATRWGAGAGTRGGSRRRGPRPGLPYVYTKWEQLHQPAGTPNDHIFSVKADTDCVWIGTEDGLGPLRPRDPDRSARGARRTVCLGA